jgi:hypothetical protein
LSSALIRADRLAPRIVEISPGCGGVKVTNESNFGAAVAARNEPFRVAQVPAIGRQDEILLVGQSERELSGAMCGAKAALAKQCRAVLMHPFAFVLARGSGAADAHSPGKGGVGCNRRF